MYKHTRGIASLPVMLLLGGIMVEIAIAGAFLLTYLNNSVYGTRLSDQAFLAAQTGINDAVLRIILNKNCGSDGNCAPVYPSTYTITTSGATAEVSICKGTCIPGKHQIISIGRALTKQHQLIATVNVDGLTGLVTVESIVDESQ